MTNPTLHPWLDTPQAVKAAHDAVRVAEARMTKAALDVGADELFSEALIILTQCALPPRERGHFACAECGARIENVRAGAKFCSVPCRNRNGVRRHRNNKEAAPPQPPPGFIGSMWSWPEDQRAEYAAREVGLALCNFLRSRLGRSEVPASGWIDAGMPKGHGPVRFPSESYVGTQTVTLDQYREIELQRRKASR